MQKRKKNKNAKCKLQQCLNNEKGECLVTVPTMIKKLSNGSIKCLYYDIDREETIKEFMSKGGVIAAIAKTKGKRTEMELKEAKKAKRKPRVDKGKKRNSKKENSLKEIL